MTSQDIKLNRKEWAEVALALEDVADTRLPASPGMTANPSPFARLLARGFGTPSPNYPVDDRRHTLRQYIAAATARKCSLEQSAPALEALGFNRRQIDALALLSAPPRHQLRPQR
jgi:hypothetical protein